MKLILTLWVASNWLLFDGRWLSAHPDQYLFRKPVLVHDDRSTRDEFSDLVVGSTIEEAVFQDQSCKIVLRKGKRTYTLEVPEDTSRLPKWAGIDRPREFHPNDRMPDAWVVTSSDLNV